MKKNNGFTLVEVIAVVALIAILLTFVVSNLNKNRALARDNIRIAQINELRLVLEEYRASCGVYPSSLDLATDNSRNLNVACSKSLGDFISVIPENPNYSTGNRQYFESNPVNGDPYLYYGVSNRQNGPCYDYIIGVPLEYGSQNDFNDGEHSKDFAKVNAVSLSPDTAHQYGLACRGSAGDGIPDADDNAYGIYGFRSTDAR